MSKKLSGALHDVRLQLADLVHKHQDDAQLLSEARDLMSVLAHIVEGMHVQRAFGAPGDWGYGTRIGDGVAHLLKGDTRT